MQVAYLFRTLGYVHLFSYIGNGNRALQMLKAHNVLDYTFASTNLIHYVENYAWINADTEPSAEHRAELHCAEAQCIAIFHLVRTMPRITVAPLLQSACALGVVVL
jgi:hypothetical protein